MLSHLLLFRPSGDAVSAGDGTQWPPVSRGQRAPQHLPPTCSPSHGCDTAPLESGQAGDALELQKPGHPRTCSLYIELSGTPAEEAKAAALRRQGQASGPTSGVTQQP